MKILWRPKSEKKEYYITQFVTRATWSGADTQASRSLEFELVNSPFDTNAMPTPIIKGGDIIVFYDDEGVKRFEGRITNKTRSSEVGTRSYIARDYMHNLVQSKASYKFSKKTPEYITRAICKDLKIGVGNLAKTKKKIKKLIVQGESPYDIIAKAYRKAKTGARYLLVMNGTKLTVVKRGEAIADFHLDSTKDVMKMEFSENADSMINQVALYNKNNKKVGVVKNAEWIKMYGIYQDVAEGESKKKKASKAEKVKAKKQLKGVEKKSTVEAIGNISCVAGRAVTILDRATKTSAEFWIKSDAHTWENGMHTMTLEMVFKKAVRSSVNPDAGKTNSQTQASKNDKKYNPGKGKLAWPCNGTIIKKYQNKKGSTKHLGIDIKAASATKIHAAEAGTVTRAGKDKNLGKVITIVHTGGLKTTYGNLSTITVKKGKRVKKGDVIGKVGSTGDAKKPQCHFAVQKNNAYKDPKTYLK